MMQKLTRDFPPQRHIDHIAYVVFTHKLQVHIGSIASAYVVYVPMWWP